MEVGAVPGPGRGLLDGDQVVETLRSAGSHPLMYSFPRGVVFTFDRDLRYLSAGGLGPADGDLTRETVEGRTVFEVFPEETSAILAPHYRAALSGHPSDTDVPYRGRVYLQRLAPVLDSAGQVVAGMGITQDVTRARAAERALRASEERNRLIFQHAPISKAIVALDGTFLQVNAALLGLTGYTEQQLLSKTFQDITHPDDLDADLDHLAQLVSGETASYRMEKRYFTASGRTVSTVLSVALVRDASGTPLYFVSQIQDITDSKREHQALQDLTGMLAHDLRNPATVILGFTEMLESHLDPGEQVAHDYVRRIATAARAMTDLLENALTTTALDSGLLVPSPQLVPVRDSVVRAAATVDLGSVTLDARGVEDVEAWVDPVHLGQVLTNLITNAVKYGGDEVVVSATRVHDRVCLVLADNGRGIEPEFVPHMFDRFSRSATARGRTQRGSGLGLYIVRDLLAANAATVGYATAPTGGARFTVDLPSGPAPD